MSALTSSADVELLRLAFVTGIAVSLLFYERWNLTTGSVVVPGYLAASLLRPASIFTTLVLALVCHVLINRVVAERVLIFGRAKFGLLALTSVTLNIAAGVAWVSTQTPGQWGSFAESAGYVVPALIAHDMGRQGVVRTTKTVLMSAAVVIALLLVTFTVVNPTSVAVPDVSWALAYPHSALPLAVLISAATAWFLQSTLGLRAGGFVGGAYVALLSPDLRSLGALAALSLVTYLLVTKVLARTVILFGRRKFSAMLLVGAVLGWWAVSLGPTFGSAGFLDFGVLSGFAIVPLFLPALIANDMERVGIPRTLAGVVISAFVVLGGLDGIGAAGTASPQVWAAIVLGLALVGFPWLGFRWTWADAGLKTVEA